ncbi:MAG: nucleoside triphosphate pyrophosphohydrolase [Bdellovibrionales bacterium]|nr:nucleoside triphosphate pyrophosphohydrolase [Bdellovibrionales bacterium]
MPANESSQLTGIQKLIDTVRALRDPATGCPWDRAQTHETLKPYALEEVHEFIESLEDQGPDSPHTWEELGDVLFQVVLHAQLLSERGLTHLDQLAGNTADKLVQRHPHVFDPQAPKFSTPQEVNQAWEKLKARKKSAQTRAQRVASVPKSLPSLQRAARIGEKAASFGFDWQNAQQVLDKVREEMQELDESLLEAGEAHAQEEFGDLLFALAQFARKRRWDPEALLAQASRKFLGRFAAMEKSIEKGTQKWDEMSLAELESHWVKAKESLRREP